METVPSGCPLTPQQGLASWSKFSLMTSPHPQGQTRTAHQR